LKLVVFAQESFSLCRRDLVIADRDVAVAHWNGEESRKALAVVSFTTIE
jgi:hypothetical protein